MNSRISPCGHTFSKNGLPGLMQRAVEVERKERNLTVDFHKPYTSEDLEFFRRHDRLFKPKYTCPLCNQVFSRPPTECRGMAQVNSTVQKLSAPYRDDRDGDDDELMVPHTCSFHDYFVFYRL